MPQLQPSYCYYSYVDPGAFALIGAAAFFGGVSRLTIALTVIMIEITNDVRPNPTPSRPQSEARSHPPHSLRCASCCRSCSR